MIGKDKLGFDVTDADTIAASDSVGAFLRSSDGTLLTHTTVGGKEALDVNVANTITTTNAANFAEDAAHTSADIGTHILAVRNDTEGSLVSADGDYASLQVDASGRLRTVANIANTVTVQATDLDIRSLDSASDSVSAVQSGTWSVNISDNGGSITVDAVDFDIRNLSASQDNVAISDGTDTLAINNDGSINAVVSATNLDIRDLAFATDSVTAHQGGTWNVNISDNGGSITVDATDLDIRDLSQATDSVRIGDGTNFLAFVGSTGIARAADFHTAAANAAVSINNTAGGTALVASALSNRTNMLVQNLGNKPVFIGVGTVTAANGIRLSPNSLLEARIGAALSLKAIAPDASTQDIRVLELA